MTDDPAKLARSLSSGRRKAVLETQPGEARPYGEVWGQVRCWLFAHGIFEYASEYVGDEEPRFRLTPFGEDVRAHLIEAANGR